MPKRSNKENLISLDIPSCGGQDKEQTKVDVGRYSPPLYLATRHPLLRNLVLALASTAALATVDLQAFWGYLWLYFDDWNSHTTQNLRIEVFGRAELAPCWVSLSGDCDDARWA